MSGTTNILSFTINNVPTQITPTYINPLNNQPPSVGGTWYYYLITNTAGPIVINNSNINVAINLVLITQGGLGGTTAQAPQDPAGYTSTLITNKSTGVEGNATGGGGASGQVLVFNSMYSLNSLSAQLFNIGDPDYVNLGVTFTYKEYNPTTLKYDTKQGYCAYTGYPGTDASNGNQYIWGSCSAPPVMSGGNGGNGGNGGTGITIDYTKYPVPPYYPKVYGGGGGAGGNGCNLEYTAPCVLGGKALYSGSLGNPGDSYNNASLAYTGINGESTVTFTCADNNVCTINSGIQNTSGNLPKILVYYLSQ